MKRIFTGLALLAFAGCCKVYCDGTELTVSFEKFRAKDTDSVWFVRYTPKTGQAIDSFRVVAQVPANDTSRSQVTQPLSANYDWKISLPALNRAFVLQNFDFTTEKCNCGGKKFKAVRSYTVNGSRKEGLFLVLE